MGAQIREVPPENNMMCVCVCACVCVCVSPTGVAMGRGVLPPGTAAVCPPQRRKDLRQHLHDPSHTQRTCAGSARLPMEGAA